MSDIYADINQPFPRITNPLSLWYCG